MAGEHIPYGGDAVWLVPETTFVNQHGGDPLPSLSEDPARLSRAYARLAGLETAACLVSGGQASADPPEYVAARYREHSSQVAAELALADVRPYQEPTRMQMAASFIAGLLQLPNSKAQYR